MTVNIPHISYPFRWGTDSHAVEVEQNTVEDILSCVTVAAKTTRGTRLYVPDFGIDDPTFTSPLDRVAIETQLRESEPRADIVSTEVIDNLVDTLTIGVGIIEQ